MTTLVTLATKDAVAMACDSLATSARLFIDPFEMTGFFDPMEWKLLRNPDGSPKLSDLAQLVKRARSIPYYHMTDVDKLLDLSPLPMGAMYTGIISIGDRTIKSLVEELKEKDRSFASGKRPARFTVEAIASRLLAHVRGYYEQEYGGAPQFLRPNLELLVAGYDKGRHLPSVYRLDVGANQAVPAIREGFGITFSGHVEEIQRVVFGIDEPGVALLEQRFKKLLEKFAAQAAGLGSGRAKLPDVQQFLAAHSLFGKENPEDPESRFFSLPGMQAEWGDFSAQNAIDCVTYLIGIMCDAHRFSGRMPTVGGAIHVALVSRNGFQFISREEYRHEDHRVRRLARTVPPEEG